MKKIIYTLSVVVVLTSACAKNSNKTVSSSDSAVEPLSTSVGKVSSDNLLGSYTVEEFIAKTIDGDFVVSFPGLTETREITKNESGALVIKQKSVLNGCTRETVSPLDISIELGVYTRGQFTHEECSGSCPAKLTGYFEGHEIQDPSFNIGCGKNDDHNESGTATIENGRLLFELTDTYSLVEVNLKTN